MTVTDLPQTSIADQGLLGYVAGQCTAGVAALLNWVQGGWGNANQWLQSAQNAGFSTTDNLSEVVPGSIVVYGSGGGYSQFGHVAVVDQVNSNGTFNVTEMNYTAAGVYDTRTSTTQDVEGFILPPNGSTYNGSTYTGSTTNSQGAGGITQFLSDPTEYLAQSFETALSPEKKVFFYILIGVGIFLLVLLLFAVGGISLVDSGNDE